MEKFLVLNFLASFGTLSAEKKLENFFVTV